MPWRWSDADSEPGTLEHGHEWAIPLGRECALSLKNPKDKRLRRPKKFWRQFAELAVDFILDVANGAELWRGYEIWNLRHFGAALPITGGEPGTGPTRARIEHFVWKILPLLDDELTLAPDHPGIMALAGAIEGFWTERRADPPRELGSAAFAAGSNAEGDVVKRKLLILGQTSYFFRVPFEQHLRDEAAGRDLADAAIQLTDDFVCQYCSPWSGLGPIDLLAEVLDLPDARRAEIRTWSHRHFAPYRIDAVKPRRLRLTNLITDSPYEVEHAVEVPDFRPGVAVLGFLVPWNGHWRWSGAQHLLGEAAKSAEVKRIRDEMRSSMGGILCRYWPEYRERVMAAAAMHHREKLAFNQGRDLMHFAEFNALVDHNTRFFQKLLDDAEAAGSGLSPRKPPPDLQSAFPQDQRGKTDGVAEFLNPDEGAETMFGFDWLLSALDKGGDSLTRDERDVLRNFVESAAVSPAFVRRVLRDHPPSAIRREFGVPDSAPDYWLDWLFRCWKGEYYRQRYPCFSVLD